MRTYDDLTGRDFEKWHVEKFVSNVKDVHYLCTCKCGFQKVIAGSSLRTGRTTQCRKCAGVERSLKGIVPLTIFNRFLDGAKKRDIEFSVSKEYVENLFISQGRKCALSGLELSFAESAYDHSHGDSTASLDRIDSRIGYIDGNVQWVHKHVNKMKQNLEQDYFIQMCQLIVSNHTDTTKLNVPPSIQFRKERSKRNKLSEEDVSRIRELKASGLKTKEIAEQFNCTSANISYITSNQSRKSC